MPALYKLSLICTVLILTLNSNIQSKIKAEQQYKTSLIPSKQLYSISLKRLQSSKQSESQSCYISHKQIKVKTQKQIFRLVNDKKSNKNRQQSIYQKITTLDDDQTIIQEFQIIGNQTFLITTDGKGYFLHEESGKTIEVNTMLNITPVATNQFFNILIRSFKQRALIITPKGVSLCRSDQANCVLLQPYQPLDYLFHAQIFIQDAITYLFLMAGDSVVVYEITAGNQLKGRTQYSSKFFQADKIHIRNIMKANSNELLFLDARRGIVSVTYEGKLSNFKTQKLIYEQPGCYQFTGNKNGDQVVLTCTLAVKSFFIQKLLRSYSFAQPHYQVTETIFTNQKIYDTAFVDNFIMSRVYSGVRLYWTSDNIAMPYPYDYNTAGNIFLHNALQSKLKVLQNGQNIIYISTQDQVRKFTLRPLDPYVGCYSRSEIYQKYKLTYTFPCANPTTLQKICQSHEQLTYSSWQHGQVKIKTMLIPLILSLVGVLIIGLVVVKVYRKNSQDIQRARLKYNTENEFGM